MDKPPKSRLKTVTIRLDSNTLSLLDNIAKKLYRSRSEIIRTAIDIYIRTVFTNDAFRKYLFGEEGEGR